LACPPLAAAVLCRLLLLTARQRRWTAALPAALVAVALFRICFSSAPRARHPARANAVFRTFPWREPHVNRRARPASVARPHRCARIFLAKGLCLLRCRALVMTRVSWGLLVTLRPSWESGGLGKTAVSPQLRHSRAGPQPYRFWRACAACSAMTGGGVSRSTAPRRCFPELTFAPGAPGPLRPRPRSHCSPPASIRRTTLIEGRAGGGNRQRRRSARPR